MRNQQARNSVHRPSRWRSGALHRWHFFLAAVVCGGADPGRVAASDAASPTRISEFLASNGAGLQDEDGDRPDWIELENVTLGSINLDGWTLTDDPRRPARWRFPSTVLAGGQFLVVFASGKDRAQPGRELHTNFKLAAEGGYLALHRPDQSLADAFAPSYPAQRRDLAYGREGSATPLSLVGPGAAVTFRVPASDSDGWNWTGAQEPFADTAANGWTTGVLAVGYDAADTVVGADLEVIGQPLQPRSIYDTAVGSLFVLASDGFTQTGEVTEWAFYSTTQHTITPLLLRLEPDGGYVIIGIGTARQSTGAGEQRHPFALQSGTAHIKPGDCFGWKDGAQGLDQTGVPAWDSSSTASIRWFQHHRQFSVGQRLGPGQSFDRAYSLQATVRGSLRSHLGTDLEQVMRGRHASIQARVRFALPGSATLDRLTLRVAYLDGFVAWLNGAEVGRRNAPAVLTADSMALTNRPREQALAPETLDLSPWLDRLRPGTNLLAFQALSDRPDSPEFFLQPALEAHRTSGTRPRFLREPTPGAPNAEGFDGWVAEVQVTPERQICRTPLEVVLQCPTPGAEIRYTTDGNLPATTSGHLYQHPLLLTNTTVIRTAAFVPGYLPSGVTTHTYLFPESVVRQPARPAGHPDHWSGHRADYEMDPLVVGNPGPTGPVEEALVALPSVCLTAPHEDWFGSERGIYFHSGQSGEAWERAATLELIFPDRRPGFGASAGIRMAGDYSSGHSATPKHSLRVTFKRKFGEPTLPFPLFLDTAVTAFDQLTLRACSTDSWPIEDPPNQSGDGSVRWWRTKATYLRDQWMRDTLRDLGHPTAHGRYVHLYLNGLYWGVYNLTERLNDAWNEAHLGGDKTEYDVLKDYAELEAGDRRAWEELMRLAARGFASEAEFQQLQGNRPDGTRDPELAVHLHVANFIDYMILHIYAGAEDWPVHNWWASRRRGPLSEGFRFYVWDQEISNDFLSRKVTLGGQRFEAVNTANSPAILYDRLRRNASFRQRFRDRLQELLFDQGALTPAACAARWQQRQAELDRAILAESARWGDARREPPYTREGEWLKEMDWQREQYWAGNHPVAIQRFKTVNLFPVLGPPSPSHPPGHVPHGYPLTLTHTNPTGVVFYTTEGADPRGPGGALSPLALPYTAPLTVNAALSLRARVRAGEDWSALLLAHYAPTDAPEDGDGDGIPDAWELAHGLNPANPDDAPEDPDADGLSNREEWLAGTEPHDPHSHLQLTLRRAGHLLDLSWQAKAHRGYVLEQSLTLDPAVWRETQPVSAQPSNRLEQLELSPGKNTGFYRVRVTPVP